MRMSLKDIKFSQHAIERAKKRKLWKYVKKEIVFYDAKLFDLSRLIFEKCIYAFEQRNGKLIITTMYEAKSSQV